MGCFIYFISSIIPFWRWILRSIVFQFWFLNFILSSFIFKFQFYFLFRSGHILHLCFAGAFSMSMGDLRGDGSLKASQSMTLLDKRGLARKGKNKSQASSLHFHLLFLQKAILSKTCRKDCCEMWILYKLVVVVL